MKELFRKLEEGLADAALLEMGVAVVHEPANGKRAFRESLEEHLTEIAFAEAADYDEIHEAIRREHFKDEDVVHADECQYGDNDICYVN